MRLFAGTPWDTSPSCDRCGLTLERCDCPPEPPPIEAELPPEKQKLTIRKEKRKKGKTVTTVTGLQFQDPSRFNDLLKELKDTCGTGGKVEGGQLVLQGDLSDRLVAELGKRGFRVRSI